MGFQRLPINFCLFEPIHRLLMRELWGKPWKHRAFQAFPSTSESMVCTGQHPPGSFWSPYTKRAKQLTALYRFRVPSPECSILARNLNARDHILDDMFWQRSPKDRSPRSRSPLMGSRHLSMLGKNSSELMQKGRSQGFGSKFATKRSGGAGPSTPEPTGMMIEADSWRGVHFEGIRAKRTFFKFESLLNSSTNRHHGKGMSIDGEEAKRRTIDSISSHISAPSTGLKMDLLTTRESGFCPRRTHKKSPPSSPCFVSPLVLNDWCFLNDF